MSTYAQVFAVARDVVRGGTVLGRTCSVGRWTPAVRIDGMHEFCVRGRNGEELALCHDAYTAAELFLTADADESVRVNWGEMPLSQHRDANVAEDDRIRRWYEEHQFSPTWIRIAAARACEPHWEA